MRTLLCGLAAVLALGAVGCTDRGNPVADGGSPAPPTPPQSIIDLGEVRCAVKVRDSEVDCTGPGGANADLLYGGQNVFVALTATAPTYDPGTEAFTFDTRVRNLIPQAIGTTDGVAAAADGIKVFFVMEPTVTVGSGAISIANADGTATFTGANQPYYRYVAILDQFEQSVAKTWQFNVEPTVDEFEFTMLVSSPVQYPDGWIDTSPATWTLSRTFDRVVTGTVLDPYGREIEDAEITWSSADPLMATVDPATGMVSGVSPGLVSINATSTNPIGGNPAAVQNGSSSFTIAGTSLVWTGGAGSTDWNAPGNWDRNVSPTAPDSVTIPVVDPAVYPVLVENEMVGRLVVEDDAELDLGVFNLTASEDVLAPALAPGGIISSSGRLIMTGTAKTVQGRLPSMRVEHGTYSLTGNLTTSGPLRIQGGRLRNASFRVRVGNP